MRTDRAAAGETCAFLSEFGSRAQLDLTFPACLERAIRHSPLPFAGELRSAFASGFGSTLLEGMPPSADAAAKAEPHARLDAHAVGAEPHVDPLRAEDGRDAGPCF